MTGFKQYLTIRNYQPDTITTLLQQVQEYKNYCNNGNDPQSYVEHLTQRANRNDPKKTLDTATLNHHFYTLRLYTEYLEAIEGKTTPLHLLYFKKQEKPVTVLSVEEIGTLFNHAETLRDKAVLACLYHLGLRAKEAASLQTTDINPEERTAFIAHSKNGWQRIVPINKTALEIFAAYLQTKSTHDHFLTGIKGPLVSASLLTIVKQIAAKAGITKRVYAHLLRHSIATHLLNNGMPIEQVSLFLGHRCIDSTRRYTHVHPET